ncbi:hypothetical protein EDB85DRAFT_2153529 [Lactarius pseudohatsudake]|nr:hypothetical protein EDB85DRAFT_2153529 [Lactarius pseudohatsudake]
MPISPYFNVLFAAGKEFWSYPKWQERTKFIVPPFADDATPALTGLSGQEINAVKALSDRIHGTCVSYAERIVKIAKLHDNDSDGLRAWDTWVRRHFVNWRVVRDIEDILTAEEIHPRQLIGTQGFGNTVPHVEDARISETYSVIAEKLFGEDAFRDCYVVRPIVKEELKELILAVVELMWDKMREEITGQYEDAQRSKEKAHAWFEELNNIDEGTKLEPSDIERWHRMVVALSECGLCFSDDAELENELEKQMNRVNWVYQALTRDKNPAMIKGEHID